MQVFDRDKIHLCTCFVDGAGHCVLLVETDRGNYILDNNQPASEPPMTNQNFGMRFLQDAIMRDNKKQKVFAFYLGESDFIAPEQRGKWKLSVKGTKSHTTDVTKPFGQKVTANDDALVFESKVEAEQWALDNGYIVLQAEQVVKNSILAVQINERKSDVK